VVGANRGDAVIYEKAFGVADRATGKAATTDMLYRAGSVGKLFTATLLMILRDEGKLHLDDPVQQYLPAGVQLPTDPRGAPAITFRHLVTHTSGLPEWSDKNPTVYDTDRAENVIEQYRGLTDVTLENPTGTRFRYSGLGSLLGHALERAGGELYEELLRKKVFAPLGMADTTITLTTAQRSRLPDHYNSENEEVARDPGDAGARWEWPTSSHLTTVGDLLLYACDSRA
jgi:CubicO group peptidase (beta-lactamase class C family)